MKQAVKLGQNLMMSADSESPDVPSLRKEVAQLPEKYSDLKARLQEQEAALEKIARDASLFNKEMDELEAWVTDAAQSTAVQDPISTNPTVVNKQLEETEVSGAIVFAIFGKNDLYSIAARQFLITNSVIHYV